MELLAGAGVQRGLVGPREVGRLWDRHVLNCAVVAPLIPPACSVLDIGSGAGLPGIVLALARPDVQVTLVEPMQRRTTFLEECVTALSLERSVAVRRARAAQLHGVITAEVVASRALAPLGRLVEWCWPLVRSGGRVLALKGVGVRKELDGAAASLPPDARVSVRRCGEGLIDPPTTVVLLERRATPRRRR